MFSIMIKRFGLLLFTFGFFICSFILIQQYHQNNKPTEYPTVSNGQLQKQNAFANGEIHKLQTIVSEAKKLKTVSDKQYSNLVIEKKTLTKKE